MTTAIPHTGPHTLFAEAAGIFVPRGEHLAFTDLTFKAIAFAVLIPAASWLLYLFRAGTSDRVVADVDIARFFFTKPAGIATLFFGISLIVAIVAVEAACLMAIGFGRAQGVTLNARSALKFGATHALKVHAAGLAHDFAASRGAGAVCACAAGLVYLALLREHDINYYLSQRPREFVIAEGLVAFIGIGLALTLVRTIVRWALALPLVLFENVHPRHALGESAKRVVGARFLILWILVAWIVVASVLFIVATSSVDLVGRVVAPQPRELAGVAAAVHRRPRTRGRRAHARCQRREFLFVRAAPHAAVFASDRNAGVCVGRRAFRFQGPTALSGRERAAILVVALLAAVGVGLLAFLVNREQNPPLVIAHRGASATAPENTLAALSAGSGAARGLRRARRSGVGGRSGARRA